MDDQLQAVRHVVVDHQRVDEQEYGVGFALPFFVDAGSFAVAAGLVFLITGQFRAKRADGAEPAKKVAWGTEIKEGFLWLWRHPLLRPMAIILGLMNALGSVTGATFILFAQEVLGVDAFTFAILGMAVALTVTGCGAIAASRSLAC